jgi:hypothetical protein
VSWSRTTTIMMMSMKRCDSTGAARLALDRVWGRGGRPPRAVFLGMTGALSIVESPALERGFGWVWPRQSWPPS